MRAAIKIKARTSGGEVSCSKCLGKGKPNKSWKVSFVFCYEFASSLAGMQPRPRSSGPRTEQEMRAK